MEYIINSGLLCISFFVLFLINKSCNKLYSVVLFYAYYVFQSTLIYINTILEPSAIVTNLKFVIFIKNDASQYLLYYLFIGIITLIVCRILLFSNNISSTTLFVNRLNRLPSKAINFWSVFFCIIYLCYTVIVIGFSPSSFFNYFVQTMFAIGGCMPFIAGISWFKLYRRVKILWISSISLILITNIIQGSRGTALVSVILFIAGLVIKMDNSKKRISIVFLCLMIIPFVNFFNNVDSFRVQYGRGLAVNSQNIKLAADYFINGSSGNNLKDNDSDSEAKFSRFINMVNLTIFSTTPAFVRYRGWENLPEELKNVLKFNFGKDDYLKFRKSWGDAAYGNGVANNYGFLVNASTSVEFSFVSDGFSRDGILGLMIFTIILVCFLIMVEKLINSIYTRNPVLSINLISFFYFNVLFSIYSISLFASIKGILSKAILLIFISYCFSIVFGKFRVKRYSTFQIKLSKNRKFQSKSDESKKTTYPLL